jgi:hypothetical protein
MLKTATSHTIINIITLCISNELRPATCVANYKRVVHMSTAVGALALLAGCGHMSPAQEGAASRARYEQTWRADHQFCLGWGARVGTQTYVDCRTAKAQERQRAAQSGGGMDPATRAILLNSALNGSTSCTSMPGLGGSVLTDCR